MMLAPQTKVTSPNDGSDRIHRIESKARLKYLRMKNSNDNEAARLKLECEKIDRKILTQFERFLRTTSQLNDVHGSYMSTSGWYEQAVRPRRREAEKFEATFKSNTNKWDYFANGTIDMWAHHPITLIRENRAHARRPRTAHVIGASKHNTNKTIRPFTAAPAGGEERNGSKSEQASRPKTAALQRQMSLRRQQQLRSRSAHSRLQRFRSPRLESDGGDNGSRDVTSPEPVVVGEGTISALAQQKSNENISKQKDTDVFEEENSLSKSFTKLNLKNHDKNTTSPARCVSMTSQSTHSASKSKFVSFTRQSSKISKTSQKMKKRKSTSSGKNVMTSDSDEDDDEKKKPPLVEALKLKENWRMPRVYVRPQERYKSAEMSMMRRHAQLQRQLARGIQPEKVTRQSGVNISTQFSPAARQHYLNNLKQSNVKKQIERKPTNYDPFIQKKVNDFVVSIQDFIEQKQ